MGCHTWTYRKTSTLSEDEKNLRVSTLLELYKGRYEKMLDKETYMKREIDIHDRIREDIQDYPQYTEENYLSSLQRTKDKIQLLENSGFDGYCQIKSYDTTRICYHNGEYYYRLHFDYPFRVYGYPEEVFTDKTELLEWLEEYSKNHIVSTCDEDDNEIDGYTNQLVDNINDYYEKYGDTLLFMFG